jgi:hypothetical protein
VRGLWRESFRTAKGTLFAVPIDGGGWGLGLATRINGEGIAVGYFFAPRLQETPSSSDPRRLCPEDAIWVVRFGDLGLIQGSWPVGGTLWHWRREDWPMPAFGRKESLTDRFWRVEYSDDDPNDLASETAITAEEFERLPEDGLAGFRFVEERLSRLLVG